MSESVKTAIVKDSSILISDVLPPSLGSDDILVQMHACGICGSDLEKVFGQYGSQSMRLGHEPAGIVIDTGSNVTKFQKGDRVFTHHHVPCYSCRLCKKNNETMCKKYSETNLQPCGLAEKYVVPGWNVKNGGVLKLSDSTTFEEATMIEPLACCVRAWNKIDYNKGDTAAVFGVGPTGMMHVMLAQMKEFSKIFCFDVNEFRLDFARKLGTVAKNAKSSDRFQKDVDVAIIATSNLTVLADAIEMVRKGGTIMMFGVPSKGATINLDMNKVYSKEITLVTSYAASDADTLEALNLIESGKINIKSLITHKYDILDTQQAFEHARHGDGAMKIIITS